MNEDLNYLLNPPTEEEQNYVNSLEMSEEGQEAVSAPVSAPEASEEDLQNIFNSLQKEDIEADKATWNDVLKSGGLRSYAGFAQVFVQKTGDWIDRFIQLREEFDLINTPKHNTLQV